LQTQKQYRDAKQEKITQAQLVFELAEHDGYKLVMSDLEKITDNAYTSIVESQTHEEFIARKNLWIGLTQLGRIVDKYVSKGKAAERTLKK